MSGDAVRLREATREDVDKITTRLKNYLPESSLIYGTIMALKAYEKMWDLLGTQIYYSDHSSLVVGTPSLYKHRNQSFYIFWDHNKEDDQEIIHLLSNIPSIDWSKPLFLSHVPLNLMKKMENFLTSGMLGNGLLKPDEPIVLQLYGMASVPDKEIKLPDGYELRDLNEEHAEFILDHWEYKHITSVDHYRCMRRALPGIGVFKTGGVSKGNDEDLTQDNSVNLNTTDNPVAWAQFSFLNLYTHTFTLPEFRRQGLAAVATLALAKKSLENTGMALSTIFAHNESSVKMHLKLGFVRMFDVGAQHYCFP
ncbi:uncharacterized protein [Palaemon carinicauda]|uniref:uncharacterized protein n=1 Tax=Palaemon carinicauda TaxID=392227 RepID=UPI0035B67616